MLKSMSAEMCDLPYFVQKYELIFILPNFIIIFALKIRKIMVNRCYFRRESKG